MDVETITKFMLVIDVDYLRTIVDSQFRICEGCETVTELHSGHRYTVITEMLGYQMDADTIISSN